MEWRPSIYPFCVFRRKVLGKRKALSKKKVLDKIEQKELPQKDKKGDKGRQRREKRWKQKDLR